MLAHFILAFIVAATVALAGAIEKRIEWHDVASLNAGDQTSVKFCFIGYVRQDTDKWTLTLEQDAWLGWLLSRKYNLDARFDSIGDECYRANFTIPASANTDDYRYRLTRSRPLWFHRYYEASDAFTVTGRGYAGSSFESSSNPESPISDDQPDFHQPRISMLEVRLTQLPVIAGKIPERLDKFQHYCDDIYHRIEGLEVNDKIAEAESLKQRAATVIHDSFQAAVAAGNAGIVSDIYDMQAYSQLPPLTSEHGCNAMLGLIAHDDHVEVIRKITRHHAGEPGFVKCVNKALFKAIDAQRFQIVQYLTSENPEAAMPSQKRLDQALTYALQTLPESSRYKFALAFYNGGRINVSDMALDAGRRLRISREKNRQSPTA